MSSVAWARWAAPAAAVTLGALIIGTALAHVPRLRQTVDLDTAQGDLVGAVDAAFQPAHVSVWLPPET